MNYQKYNEGFNNIIIDETFQTMGLNEIIFIRDMIMHESNICYGKYGNYHIALWKY